MFDEFGRAVPTVRDDCFRQRRILGYARYKIAGDGDFRAELMIMFAERKRGRRLVRLEFDGEMFVFVRISAEYDAVAHGLAFQWSAVLVGGRLGFSGERLWVGRVVNDHDAFFRGTRGLVRKNVIQTRAVQILDGIPLVV